MGKACCLVEADERQDEGKRCHGARNDLSVLFNFVSYTKKTLHTMTVSN